MPVDSDVRTPCDVLLDEADRVEADATAYKGVIDELYESHVSDGISHLRVHFDTLSLYHRALRNKVDAIRQELAALLVTVKDRHAVIMANPFPDRDYDVWFSWAISQS